MLERSLLQSKMPPPPPSTLSSLLQLRVVVVAERCWKALEGQLRSLPAQPSAMNWNNKEYNEISLNKIWSEHVRPARLLPEFQSLGPSPALDVPRAVDLLP